jgi:hypothetical protein
MLKQKEEGMKIEKIPMNTTINTSQSMKQLLKLPLLLLKKY